MNNKNQKNNKFEYKINDDIKSSTVRVILDDTNTVMNIYDAKKLAESKGLDLVEISPSANPPVCKIIEYSKFIYQLKKKEKENKKNQVNTEIKELRFGPQTDDHDYQFKLNHAKEFLKNNNKVRAYVFFKGRSIMFKEQGEILLLRLANDLEDYCKVEQLPKLEGKKMYLLLAPKKLNKNT